MYRYFNPYLIKKASAMPDTGDANIGCVGAPVDKSTRIRRMLDGNVKNLSQWMSPEEAFAKRAAYEESMRYYPGDAVMTKVAAFDPAKIGEFLKGNYGRIGMGLLGLLLGAGLGKSFLGKKLFGEHGGLTGGTIGGMLGAMGGSVLQSSDFGKNISEKYVNPFVDKVTRVSSSVKEEGKPKVTKTTTSVENAIPQID